MIVNQSTKNWMDNLITILLIFISVAEIFLPELVYNVQINMSVQGHMS